jgi:hypothetical protein
MSPSDGCPLPEKAVFPGYADIGFGAWCANTKPMAAKEQSDE